MKKLWTFIFKPKGIHASWLLLIALIGFMWLWTQGHFDILKTHLDTDKFTYEVGDIKISVYLILKSILSIIVVFWTTAIVSDFAEKRVKSISKMNVADKALVQKILQIIIYFIALLIMLNIIGIDLTSLTVLSGALGIGLGFGLQKIAANFVSGMILLIERSIKPGDLLELEDGTFGYVRKSSSRATLIETIDGKEVLVPNEEFITKQVVNWTLSKPTARVTINFGVSYSSDIEKARELALEAINEHPRCSDKPDPQCFLDNFGDSSVDFICYFWIDDINDGFRNIKSDILFSIWHKFKAHDIEIPFPQRDLHLKTATAIEFSNPTKG